MAKTRVNLHAMAANEITFKIHPPDGGSEVPVSLLIQSLGTLEELIHLFAFQEEGNVLRHRFRPNADLLARYELRMQVPKTGSYAMAGTLTSQRPELYDAEKHGHVVHSFQEFGKAIQSGRREQYAHIVPESRLRERILRDFSSLCPPAGSGYSIELLNGTGAGFTLTEATQQAIDEAISTPQDREEMQTVTGKLDAIRFNERKLDLFYSPKRRKLECNYSDELEPMLWENRRDLIQVRGKVILDLDGHPERIDDVEEIMELDLSPFRLTVFTLAAGALNLRETLLLQPYLSEDEQLLCLEHEPWDLLVYAQTRQELSQELRAHMAMLWSEYAMEDDIALDGPALALKQRLLSDLKYTAHA